MKTALQIIGETAERFPRFALTFSGGNDSNVLLDLVFTQTQHRPPVIFCDSQLEYPESLDYVRRRVESYPDAYLHVTRGAITPAEQWAKRGWPFLGKLSARKFMQKYRHIGVKMDVTDCCRRLKIAPARQMTKDLGCKCQMTGQKGASDDALRALRTLKDGAIHYAKADSLWISNPLTGWTDTMIRRYLRGRKIEPHPARARGAVTIGCVVCGGGAQFDNSGWRILRDTWPEAWRHFFVARGAGYAALAVKWRRNVYDVMAAVEKAGGLEKIATERPWLFDYLETPPRRGYRR